MTALILATIALALSVFAVIWAIRDTREPIRLYFNTELTDRLDALEADLHLTKERVNADLVEHNQRLNRHREKLIRDYNRLLIIDQKLKEQSR